MYGASKGHIFEVGARAEGDSVRLRLRRAAASEHLPEEAQGLGHGARLQARPHHGGPGRDVSDGHFVEQPGCRTGVAGGGVGDEQGVGDHRGALQGSVGRLEEPGLHDSGSLRAHLLPH